MTRGWFSLVLRTFTAVLTTAQAPQVITIRAGRLLDGRGGSQRDVVVTIDNRKIDSTGHP